MSQSKSRSSHQKRKLKEAIFGSREYMHCCFCKRVLYFNEATLEHIVPLAEGGSWSRSNLTCSCPSCNNERKTTDFETFRKFKRGQL